MKKICILIYILLILLIVGGCKDKKIPKSIEQKEIFKGVFDTSDKTLKKGVRGGTFIRADIPELDTFNIVTTRSKPVYAVLKLIFESLLSVNPITGKIQGGIVKDYSIINNGYSILLHLNENIRFSDGVCCTAEDVIFSFEEIYMNPDVDSKKTDILKVRDRLISIEKIDRFTVQIDLPVPYRPFLYTLAHLEILPKHIISPIIESNGIEAFNKDWGNQENDIKNIIGTGPYCLEEYRKGELIRLTRNPYYAKREGGLYIDGMPYFDEIIELLNVDSETKILKFQIGEIDFYNIKTIDIASGDFEALINNRVEGNYQIYSGGYTLNSNHFLVFNQNPDTVEKEKLDLFQDRMFRNAISHLINKKFIKDNVYKGYAFIDSSPERDISPFYKKVEASNYDPDKAKTILSQLNLGDSDGDGYLNLPSGKPFHFIILTNEDNPFRIKIAQIITASFKEAGLMVDFEAVGYDLIVTKLLDTFDWEAIIIGIEGSIEPNDSSWVWESKGPLHLWLPYQETPYTDWERRIDELFALGRTTWDFEKASTYYQEYQNIIARELPVINIVIPAELYGFRNGFGNLIPKAVSYNTLALVPYIYREVNK